MGQTQCVTQTKSFLSWSVESSRVHSHRLVNEHTASWEGSFQGRRCVHPQLELPCRSRLHLCAEARCTEPGCPTLLVLGPRQRPVNGCVGREIEASWVQETLSALGVPKGRRGHTTSESISAHLFSCLGSFPSVPYRLCLRQIPQGVSQVTAHESPGFPAGEAVQLGDDSRSNEGYREDARGASLTMAREDHLILNQYQEPYRRHCLS